MWGEYLIPSCLYVCSNMNKKSSTSLCFICWTWMFISLFIYFFNVYHISYNQNSVLPEITISAPKHVCLISLSYSHCYVCPFGFFDYLLFILLVFFYCSVSLVYYNFHIYILYRPECSLEYTILGSSQYPFFNLLSIFYR